MFKTPIVFIIFNRLEKSLRVFEKIRQMQPERLFVIADGPRNKNEIESCLACRGIIQQVDWECDLKTNFSNRNLGCGIRISSGLDWVFLHVDQAIILEDDCVPDLSFFSFCEELLNRYKNDTRIATISGTNFFDAGLKLRDSYFFSHRMNSWGWATWRRAWQWYDNDMRLWPQYRDEKRLYDLMDGQMAQIWSYLFQNTYMGKIDTWAYKFFFNTLTQNAFTIIPKVNLVMNIGFDETATHTKNKDALCANYPVQKMNFPLSHPQIVNPIKSIENKLFQLT